MGVDPFKTDGSLNLSENFAAAIAKQWSRPGRRLGFRVQLAGGREPSTTQRFNILECDVCSLTRTQRYAELNAAAVLTFRNNHRFRPYVLGGPGIYRVSTSYLARGTVLGSVENPSSSSYWSLGVTAGAGASLRLFGKELFVEQRILLPQATTGYRMGPVPHPLSIGVKFER
jgi:opacity protein-like surface antigen